MGPQSVVWARHDGGNSASRVGAMAADAAGNVSLVGSFFGAANFGGDYLNSKGDMDIYLARYDAGGNPLWSTSYGSPGTDSAEAVAPYGDGGMVVAGCLSGTNALSLGGASLPALGGADDIFVARYDAAGHPMWSKRFGSPGDDGANAVAVDATGAVVVVGYYEDMANFAGTLLPSAGKRDVFVARLAANGDLLWVKGYGGPQNDSALAVAVDTQGNIALTGSFRGTAAFGGMPLQNPSDKYDDVFVAKYGPDGKYLASRAFGGAGNDGGESIAVDPAGNVILTGEFEQTVDFGTGPKNAMGGLDVFLVRLSPDLSSAQLVQAFGGPQDDQGQAVVADGRGNLIVSGFFHGSMLLGGQPLLTSAGGRDAFTLKFAPDGGLVWPYRLGGTKDDSGDAVAVDGTGAVLSAGVIEGTVDIGKEHFVTTGGDDVYVVKLLP